MSRSRVIAIRVSEEEMADIKRWAEASGKTISEYMRDRARSNPSLVVTGAAQATVAWRL